MSVEYIPVSSKSAKVYYEPAAADTDLSMQSVPLAKSSKAAIAEESEGLDALPAQKSKSSKSILPIAPRSVTLGEELEADVSEANSQKNSAEDARVMSAASVVALGAMLFL